MDHAAEASKVQTGTRGDDHLVSSEHVQRLLGLAGNDVLDLSISGGGAYGGAGNDTLIGGGGGARQSHMYGGSGDDDLHLGASNYDAPYASHVWGGSGADRFIFDTIPGDTKRVIGRIDDLDISRDRIILDGQEIDLRDPGPRVRILQQFGQPWLLIDNRILYALEGARQFAGLHDSDPDGDGEIVPEGNDGSNEERHYMWPAAWEGGMSERYDVPYLDFENSFPAGRVDRDESAMTLRGGSGDSELIEGGKVGELILGDDGNDTIHGNGGDDLIQGDHGHDLIYGGDGADSISGGLDNDLIHGGRGQDIIYGGSGEDTLHGDEGHDELRGNAGRDLLYGGAGDDTLIGGWGSDMLYGGAGDDVLHATIPHGEGSLPWAEHDTLNGGDGDDTLHAGQNGTTTMIGGAGSDLMFAAKDNVLFLKDFMPGQDLLDLGFLDRVPADMAASLQHHERFEGLETGGLLLNLSASSAIFFEGLGQAQADAVLASIRVPEGIERVAPEDVVPWKPAPLEHEAAPEAEDEKEAAEEKEATEEEAQQAGGGGCFVATACFGGAAHPDVDWLRRFRTARLMPSLPGRVFCITYHHVGPWLAPLVRHDRISGRWMRGFLGALVRLGRRIHPDI